MEERISKLEKDLTELKSLYLKENYPSEQVIRKDTTFIGRIGFFTKSNVSQQSAISAPSTPSGAYVQAEAQSTVDAVNSIRTVLQNLGLTS